MGSRTGRRPGRVVAGLGALAVAVCALLVPAAPAAAHAGMTPDAPFYRSVVTGIAPQVPGLVVSVERTGETVTVTNGTGRAVEVTGVSGEPFLRFGPEGVEENTASLTSRLNAVRVLGAPPAPPPSATAVVWKHVSDDATYTWSDHRTHWMSRQRPPRVAADPGNPHPVSTWKIRMTVDGTPVTVEGALSWAGASATAGWVAPSVVGGLVLLALVAVGLAVRSRTGRP